MEDTTTTVDIIATALTIRYRPDKTFLTDILNLLASDIKLHLIDLGSLVGYKEYGNLNILHASLGDFWSPSLKSYMLIIDQFTPKSRKRFYASI